MRTNWLLLATVGGLLVFAGCSSKTVYHTDVNKSEMPKVEQQTVPPGQLQASNEALENGKRKWRVGDHKGAMKHVKQAVQKNPYNFEAHYWLAVMERDNEHFDKAGFHFAEALQYCPAGRWESRIRVDWGYLFEMQGQKGMAAKQYDLALLADPEFRDAQTARARVLPSPNARFED